MERIHGGRRIYTAGGRVSKGGDIVIDSKRGKLDEWPTFLKGISPKIHLGTLLNLKKYLLFKKSTKQSII